MDGKSYDETCEKRREENEAYLNEFESWLTAKGLSNKTIQQHMQNVDFFLNNYLLFEGAYGMEVGCTRMDDFLGYFFIHKCMWSTPTTIKQNATSFKKFYQCMLEKGHIAKESYQDLLEDIKYGMSGWLDECEDFNNPDSDVYDDLMGLGPDSKEAFGVAYDAVARSLGLDALLGVEPEDSRDYPFGDEDEEEDLPSREEVIQQMTLMLFYLTSWKEKGPHKGTAVRRAWKSADWDAIDWLREAGLIDCSNKAKSVTLTDKGSLLAKLTLVSLGLEHLIDEPLLPGEEGEPETDAQPQGSWKLL